MNRRCNKCFTRNHLLKKQNLCHNCFILDTIPYTKMVVSDYDNPCGGTTVFRVMSDKYLRLHCIMHYELSRDYDFMVVNTWNQVWNKCEGWIDERSLNKPDFKGELKRGLMYAYGNGIFASVENKNGKIYFIYGVWG